LRAAIWPTSTPDRQVDCLKIPPLTAGETAWGPLKGVHIGAAIQEQRYRLCRASANRPMERRGARGITEIDKVRIRIEQPTDFGHVTPCRRRVNRMIAGLRTNNAAAIHCLFAADRMSRLNIRSKKTSTFVEHGAGMPPLLRLKM
jgi:hypothetical protein